MAEGKGICTMTARNRLKALLVRPSSTSKLHSWAADDHLTGHLTGVIDSLLLEPRTTSMYLPTPPPSARKVTPPSNRYRPALSNDTDGSDDEMLGRRRENGAEITDMMASGGRRSPGDNSYQPRSASTSCSRSVAPSLGPPVQLTPPPKLKVPILSIDEIVRRHSGAMASAEATARDKARLELGLATPRSETACTTPTSSRSFRRRKSPPTVPSRISSSPGVRVKIVPPRTTSMIAGSDGASTLTRTLFETGESVSQGIQIGQALLDQLEKGSVNSSTSSSPSSGEKVKVSSYPHSIASMSIYEATEQKQTTSQAVDDQETDDHAIAVYLRSPHLNRFMDLPRPFPERPLRVSLAEVGSPSGRPVVLFLGLGCVRYLVALFDDLAKVFNLHLICIDRWGLGKTDNVLPERRGTAEWAHVVERVLDQLGIGHCQLLAHSAGAPYACAAAVRLEDRVRGRLHLLAPWISAEVDGGKRLS